MEERPESEADADFELRPEDLVAADEAMLLDLGDAEQLADMIADQTLGRRRSSTTSGADRPPTATPSPAVHEDDNSPT